MKSMRPCFCLFLQVLLLIGADTATAEVQTFFAGTQYALDVFFLRGEKPGPTIMVQGGIQGDESSGYLTAQLLAKAKITKGTVIIVPRANPPSINLHKRAVNVDLNRRFDKESNEFYEDNLARLIRYLVGQSQGLIHLHEGSGFYNPVKVDNLNGPTHYGQSIIIDSEEYNDMHLGTMANNVLTKLNEKIKTGKYKFKLFSMETLDERTKYAEQRKSLTYYAVTQVGVPAFAIEVSKDLVGPYWSYWKVAHQLQAVVLFLNELGVELDPPSIDQDLLNTYPSKNMNVFVNGRRIDQSVPVVHMSTDKPLKVRGEVSGQPNMVESIISVFASDRPDFNILKASRLPMAHFKAFEIRSDGILLKKVNLAWNEPRSNHKDIGHKDDLMCWLNGELKSIAPGQTITAVEGDQLILEGIKGSKLEEKLNLKGYISSTEKNNGQDAGREIILDPLAFIPKFLLQSEKPGECSCEVVRQTPGMPEHTYTIRILSQQISALVLTAKNGNIITVPWYSENHLKIPPGQYTLTDIRGNGSAKTIRAFIGKTPIEYNHPFEIKSDGEIVLRQATTFKELGRMFVSGKA